MREKMANIPYILMISMAGCFVWSYGQEQVRMTILSSSHIESEVDQNSHYQCRLSYPDNSPNDVTVESFRTGWTRNTEEENIDPPDALYDSRTNHPYYRVNMRNNDNNDAFGVFGCNATKDGKKETIISTTRMRSDADIVPRNSLFSQTVSIGDRNVNISMRITSNELHVDQLRWRQNNNSFWGGSLPGIDPNFGVDTFTFNESIGHQHAGIYECHRQGGRALAKHGLNLLIVRACPHTRWGPPTCDGICDSCYNGGVCDEDTGRCVCAPGFKGRECLIACGGNRYGYGCEQRCTYKYPDPKYACRGTLFCLVHPFGCRCNTGFKGLDCSTACDANTFGASCLQSCHCLSDRCNRYTGACETYTGCDVGWTGQFCQKCVDGNFGSSCDQKCHCSSETCNRESGLCKSGGCLPQWADLFLPYSCQTGLERASYTRVNSNIAFPLNCSAVQGPGGNLSDFEVVLSRIRNGFVDNDIALNDTLETNTTITRLFTVSGVVQDVTLYCQLRYKSDKGIVAKLTVDVDLYELPQLMNAPIEESTTNSSVTVRWSAWNRYTDDGDPPIVGYIPYHKKQGGSWKAGNQVPTNGLRQFTLSNLDPDIVYSFSVVTIREGEGGEGSMSPSLDVKTICAVPLNGPNDVVANIAGDKQELVKISWQHPHDHDIRCNNGVRKFNIYITSTSLLSNYDSLVEVTDTTATHKIISNLEVGERYVFYMTFTTEGGDSRRSNQETHLLPVLPQLTLAPRSADITTTTMTISWIAWDADHNGGTSPVVSYKLYRKLSYDREWNIFTPYHAINGEDEYFVTVRGLDPDTRYDFSVAAVRAGRGGEGPRSPSLKGQKTTCDVPASGPQNVITNIAGDNQQLVEISWEHPSDYALRCRTGVQLIKIYYSVTSLTPSDENVREITNSFSTSYVIDGLKVGEEYVFEMTVTTEGGESTRSNPVHHLVPKLPELSAAPRLSDVTATTLTITWRAWDGTLDEGDPPVVSYDLSYKLSDVVDWNNVNVVSHSAGDEVDIYYATVKYLTPDTLYDFRVTAVRRGRGGKGRPSPPLENQKTLCDISLSGPRDVFANIAGENQELVNISWKAPSDFDIRCKGGVMKFTIYYSLTSTQFNNEVSKEFDSEATWSVIEGLTVGEEYVFAMTLTTDGGESGRSNQRQHLVPVLPMLQTNLSSKDNGCDKITITWQSWTEDKDKGSPPIVEYIPYHRKSSMELDWIKGDVVSDRNNHTTRKYTFKNLIEEEIYDFAIAVVREHGGEGEKRTYQEKINKCPVSPGAIVGSTMGSLLFVVLVIIVVILWTRRKITGKAKNKRAEHLGVVNSAYSAELLELSTASKSLPENEDEAVYVNAERPPPILLVKLENYIKTTALEQQFLMFKNESQFPSDVGNKEENKTKNRFRNMIAYDHSRVVLPEKDDDPHSDYYNANYLKNSKGEICFIASQGPNKASVEDFWRIVWMEKVVNIVMLTNLVEKGKDRCFRYWPSSVGETMAFGRVKVKWQSSDQYANFDVRDYKIFVERKVHRVYNWHFKTWPDKDVPDQPSSLIEFARRVKKQQKKETVPLLVHCSAGVGRTGTFIALCSLMDDVKTCKKIDVYGFVEQMREDRINMVQTAKQYKFLHECLFEVYLTGDTAIPVNKLTTFDVQSQRQKLDKEFKLLAKFGQMSRLASSDASNEFEKSRFPDLLPVEKKRPYLQSPGKNSSSNYINACSVMSYRNGSSFIATQSPLPSTIEDFWRLVLDWKCPLIVMLNQLDKNDGTVCKYWPDAGLSRYGHITVELKVKQKEHRYISRLFEVDHAHMQKPILVQHLQLNSWDENKLWDIYGFIRDIEKLQQDFRMVEPTVIHCINGVGRTGVVLAVKSEIERIEAEEKIDVFSTVRQMRASNLNLVHTLEEYTLCYQLLKMNSPEATYANI